MTNVQKLKVDDLPIDILYNISTFSNVIDLCNFQNINKKLRSKIYTINSDILSYQLYSKNTLLNQTNFYNFLNYQLVNILYKYKKRGFLPPRDEEIMPEISNDKFINKLFTNIFNFYVYNNFCDIRMYKNKFELFAFYIFLEIESFTNYNFNYFFNFLEKNHNSNLINLKIKYYNSVLYKFHSRDQCIFITFDQMYAMSKYTISIPVVKKIIGYKMLDLSNSLLNLCCFECNEKYIREICNIRRKFFKDELISFNYNQFKKMLQKNNSYYYQVLCNSENYLVNSMIYIKNPITNRRIKINNIVYQNTINLIKEIDINKMEKMKKYICNQQLYFKNKFIIKIITVHLIDVVHYVQL